MSQLYLYSNIWIYIWSVFSRVGTYFTYLIHNEASPVCGNYLPCETQCGDRGALREGLSRPLGLLTKTWLVVCTPPFISIISEIVVGWLRAPVAKHYPAARQSRASHWSSRARRQAGRGLEVRSVVWAVSGLRYSKQRDQSLITFYMFLIEENSPPQQCPGGLTEIN